MVRIVCINLDRAPERWETMGHAFRRIGVDPDRYVERLSAIDGSAMSPADLVPFTTPHVRLNLQHPQIGCESHLLSTIQAVACTLSHVRAWQDFLATKESHLVVFEDDAVPDGRLAPLLRGEDGPLNALRTQPPPVEWDVVFLGHTPMGFWDHVRWRFKRPSVHLGDGLGLCGATMSIYGSHAYMISRRGAKRLLRNVFPAEVHVDMFMIATHETGRLRAFFMMPSLAHQGGGENFIPHPRHHLNYKMVLPDVSIRLVVIVALLVFWLVVVWRKHGIER